MLVLAILLQDSLVLSLWIVLALSIAGLFFVLIHQFLLPYIYLKSLELPDPVSVGDQFDLVVEESSRQAKFTIGKKIGDIKTLCKAIMDDHLVLEFKKNRDNEEYEISIKRNGACLFKPPRMDVFSKMESKEKLESYEIIGHSAEFRISDRFIKERMVNFIEIRLSSKFYFNKMGKERMKFSFTITKIHPGLNRANRNRDGSYDWGQEESEVDEEDSD